MSPLGLTLGGASHTTAVRQLAMLVDTMAVRRLDLYLAHVGKRPVNVSKVCVRDSGLQHVLLRLRGARDLQGHPAAGASWMGFVIEQFAAALPASAQTGLSRTASGAGTDLVVACGAGSQSGHRDQVRRSALAGARSWQAVYDVGARRAAVAGLVGWAHPARLGRARGADGFSTKAAGGTAG